MEINSTSQTFTGFSTNSSVKSVSKSDGGNIAEGANLIKSQVVRTKEIKEKDVRKAVEKLNVFLEDNKTHAEYEIHPMFKDVMIKIVDDKTGEVVLEVPPKKILDMIAKMCEMVGVMVDKKA